MTLSLQKYLKNKIELLGPTRMYYTLHIDYQFILLITLSSHIHNAFMEAIEAEADHFMASKNGFRCQKTMVLEADLSVFLIHDLLT